jgi:hypothetical protein
MPGVDMVFVDDAQGAKIHVARSVIFAERKCVMGVEPTEIEVAARGGFANVNHRSCFLLTGRAGAFASPLFPKPQAALGNSHATL